jgi:hypothetical protein
MKYLFIGGLAHGQWYDTNGYYTVKIAQPRPFVVMPPEHVEEIIPRRIDVYMLHKLQIGRIQTEPMYIEEHLTGQDAVYLFQRL